MLSAKIQDHRTSGSSRIFGKWVQLYKRGFVLLFVLFIKPDLFKITHETELILTQRGVRTSSGSATPEEDF